MAFVAFGATLVDALIVGGLIGGTVLVVGGSIAMIIDLVQKHEQEMRKIINLRERTIRELENQHEKELHRHKEFQKVFKLFQVEVEQAEKLITEAEYTDQNGKKIKGYTGKNALN